METQWTFRTLTCGFINWFILGDSEGTFLIDWLLLEFVQYKLLVNFFSY